MLFIKNSTAVLAQLIIANGCSVTVQKFPLEALQMTLFWQEWGEKLTEAERQSWEEFIEKRKAEWGQGWRTYLFTSGFRPHLRPCTARTRPFRLLNKQNGALRALCPAHRSFAGPSSEINVMLQRKPSETSQFGEKTAKGYFSYSSIRQLQVSLWITMFSQIRLKQWIIVYYILPVQYLPL